jgi:anaphase-promoting complex subunit 10
MLDESYTPSKVVISAGTSLYDLIDVKVVELREPRGWQAINIGDYGRKFSLSPLKPFPLTLLLMSLFQIYSHLKNTYTYSSGVVKAFLVQIAILANHQNGKDTHLRGVKVFAPAQAYVRSHGTLTYGPLDLDGPWWGEEHEKEYSIR